MTQAENTTTTAIIEQPAQPQNIEVSAMDKAIAADTRKTITLEAEAALQELEPFGTEPGTYGENSAVQGEYWRFRFRGAVCTVSPEFKKAYDDGTIISVTASPTLFERNVPDPNNAGMTKTVIRQGWSLTHTDILKMKKGLNAKLEVAKIRKMMEAKEKVEEIKIDAMIAAIDPAKIKASIKPEDMDALLAAM